MNKLAVILLIFMLLVFGSLLFFTFFTKYDIRYKPIDCELLMNCILIERSCLERHVDNNLFGLTWSLDDKAPFLRQNDYYYDNCLIDTRKGSHNLN